VSQQPNIEDTDHKLQTLSDLPVPRSQAKKDTSSNLKHPFDEVFSIPSPDSGYALKLIKKYEHFWNTHHKKKLITKIISNLVIYQASLVGRGPTKSDIERVLEVLQISENSLGLLNKENLQLASKETIKGLHLSELISSIDVDKI
tara:strand:+ start:230 stop:664 length:435 start_codon:yes stop_codon:yes gene_type:complete